MTDMPEFSVLLASEEVPSAGTTLQVRADDDQRAALAARFSLLSLHALSGDFRIDLLAGGPMLRVSGTVKAVLEQACVVTGDPVPESLEIDVAVDFAPPGMIEENVELTLSDADPPEALEGGLMDLGELAVQQMALAMDPYPRGAGADLSAVLKDLPDGPANALDDGPGDNPFAALASLKGGGADAEEER